MGSAIPAATAAADDPAIPNETALWRRIPPWQWMADDQAPGGFRPSSDIFNDNELSVVIVAECTIDVLLAGHDNFGVAEFSAGDIRGCGWGIVRAPDDKLPGHCHVTGKNKKQKTRGRLARSCRIVREPVTGN
jgi:hypothetical protein